MDDLYYSFVLVIPSLRLWVVAEVLNHIFSCIIQLRKDNHCRMMKLKIIKAIVGRLGRVAEENSSGGGGGFL